jgi:integrase
MLAVAVTKNDINAYIESMKSAKGGWKKNATINRTLQIMSRAYKLAMGGKNPKLSSAPEIKKLNEKGNVRKGKFSQAEAELVFSSLPEYMSDVARFAYETGTRAGELLKLKWSYLDGDAIEVLGSDTKNGEPRSIVLTPELEQILERRRVARVKGCDLIFHHNGHAIVDYRGCWQTACVVNGLGRFYCRDCRDAEGNFISVLDAKSDCPLCGIHCETPRYIGRLFHDFRRSCAYELWKANGQKERECMEVRGHKTPSMFTRYADLFSKQEKLESQRKAQQKRRELREVEADNLLMMPTATGTRQ